MSKGIIKGVKPNATKSGNGNANSQKAFDTMVSGNGPGIKPAPTTAIRNGRPLK